MEKNIKSIEFESNVIYIGTKTTAICVIVLPLFESNVIYIGTKTYLV